MFGNSTLFSYFYLVEFKDKNMKLVERFLRYVSFDTQSDENSGVTPSSAKQMVFAQYLKGELEALGLEEIELDEHGYLYATLPANTEKEVPTIGFIAHMDTSPDMSGANVTPRIVHNYDGSDIVLCEEENIVLAPSQFPELLDHKGEDLIVTNGKTLLGADDKAGIAEILSAAQYLLTSGGKHATLKIGFTPDEEVGLGTSNFDIPRFGADFAYTLDGGQTAVLIFMGQQLNKIGSYDGGKTWEMTVYEDGVQSRPDILEYRGKPLMIYNYKSDKSIQNFPPMHNFRNSIKMIYDGKVLKDIFS